MDYERAEAQSWDLSRLGDAMEAVARQSNLLPRPAHAPAPPIDLSAATPDDRDRWVNLVASHLGIEAEPVSVTYGDVEQFVGGIAPGIIEYYIPDENSVEPEQVGYRKRYLAVLNGGRKLTVLAPDLKRHQLDPQYVRALLVDAMEAPNIGAVDEILTNAGVPPERRAQVRRSFLSEQMSLFPAGRGWMLRHLPGASYIAQARAAKIFPLLAAVLITIVIQQGIVILGWGIIGSSALQGHFDWIWLWAWAALLLTAIPLQLLTTTAGARLGAHLGGIFRESLLYGVLKLDPEDIRHEGIGHFLDRIMDADVVQYGGINSALTVALAVSQLIAAFAVLLLSIAGWASAAILAVIVVVMLGLGLQYWRSSQWGAATYRDMTNNLVERLIGHRTRLAQQDPASWHLDEDRELAQYLDFSEREARFGNWLGSLPQVWMVLGLGACISVFVLRELSPAELAVSLGGVLLAQQALGAIAQQVAFFIPLTLAWRQVRPVFQAARREIDKSLPAAFTLAADRDMPEPTEGAYAQAASPLITLRNVSFRYRERARLALEDVNLEINARDRILLEGPSGGGKSTLAAILAGLRIPEAGLLLLRGYDRVSLGADAWRERIVVAPQFHENHVFAETFAFNLLMGRRWPATPDDEQEALEICAELGLDSVITRMPSGLHQIVGESGWQLSHGERSRLFIARALLQRAELIILDESFAALDPENLRRALECVLRRAQTLLVIAHP